MNIKLSYLKILLLISILFAFSCKTKINQVKDNLQEGRWITTDTFDRPYTMKAKYHKGKEVGTWRYFDNGILVRKEKYKKGKCLTKYYHPNGKLMKKGFTKMDINEKEVHWYYDGVWHFYDENGKLTFKKTFEKGVTKQIDSIEH